MGFYQKCLYSLQCLWGIGSFSGLLKRLWDSGIWAFRVLKLRVWGVLGEFRALCLGVLSSGDLGAYIGSRRGLLLGLLGLEMLGVEIVHSHQSWYSIATRFGFGLFRNILPSLNINLLLPTQ